jgi:hypothetical protein
MTGPQTDHSDEIAKLDAVEAELRAEDARNAGAGAAAEAAASGTSTDPNDRGTPAAADAGAGTDGGTDSTVDVHTSTAPGIISDGGQSAAPAPGNSQVNAENVGGVAPQAAGDGGSASQTDTGAAPADTGAPAATEGTASESDPTDAVITQARDDVAAIRDRVRAQAHSNRSAASVLNALDTALALINEAINTPA